MTPRTDPAAVLWDFDGTLVDTETYWMAAERELVGEYGGTWTDEQGLQLVGNDLLVSGRMIIDQTGIPLTPAQVVDRLIDGVVAHIRDRIRVGPVDDHQRIIVDVERASPTDCQRNDPARAAAGSEGGHPTGQREGAAASNLLERRDPARLGKVAA